MNKHYFNKLLGHSPKSYYAANYVLSMSMLFIVLISAIDAKAPLNFATTTYYTASGTTLTSSGTNLSTFNFNTGTNGTTGGILGGGGVYLPAQDATNNNLWVHLTWKQADPNGTAVGANVPASTNLATNANGTTGGTLGGYTGFLYEIEIYL